jgi:hypothetical protein
MCVSAGSPSASGSTVTPAAASASNSCSTPSSRMRTRLPGAGSRVSTAAGVRPALARRWKVSTGSSSMCVTRPLAPGGRLGSASPRTAGRSPAGGGNRVAVRIDEGMSHHGRQTVGVGLTQLMLEALRLGVPLRGLDPGTVGEVALPQPMRAHDAQRPLATGFGEAERTFLDSGEIQRCQPFGKSRRLVSRNLERTGEALQRRAAAGRLDGQAVLDGILHPHAFVPRGAPAEARQRARARPENEAKHEDGEQEGGERDEWIDHGLRHTSGRLIAPAQRLFSVP